MRRLIQYSVLATLAACASGGSRAVSAPSTSGDQRAQAAPAAHDMASMPGMEGMHHDMGMADHATVEAAFLFPGGDDKGWSKVENGMQHNMAPEVPLAKLDAATRLELLHQL